MKNMPGLARQKGIALITAVLVVSLAVIAASAMLTSSHLAIYRANNLQDTERAWWYATGVEAWVGTILDRDLKTNQSDSLLDIWAQPVDFLPLDQGFLRGGVVDLQGRFNLNNLATTDPTTLTQYVAQFERLCEELEIDAFVARGLTQLIRDWIDADQTPTPNDGAEDSDYLQLPVPYRAANRLMQSPTELMAVKGVTREVYAALLPYITALPKVGTPINVNTAPEIVVRSLVAKPTTEMETFLRDRIEKPADTIQDPAIGIPAGGAPFDVRSNFFQLRAETTIGNARVALYSLYYRTSQGSVVLARSTDSE